MDESKLYFKLLKERILKAIDDGVDATEITERLLFQSLRIKLCMIC